MLECPIWSQTYFALSALGDQHRREEVPEVMKTDTRETGFCGDSAEDELVEVVGVHTPPCWPQED
jgi:hypothetical protein